jgi:hypothetical protein
MMWKLREPRDAMNREVDIELLRQFHYTLVLYAPCPKNGEEKAESCPYPKH